MVADLLQGNPPAVVFLATKEWRRKSALRLEANPDLCSLLDCMRASLERNEIPVVRSLYEYTRQIMPEPDGVDLFMATLEAWPTHKLGVVASRFSTGGPGSYGAALADTDPVDVRYYFDVNRKIREGLKMKAACAAIAKEYGDHQTKIGTLTKRYRRLHARLGPLLRSGSEP